MPNTFLPPTSCFTVIGIANYRRFLAGVACLAILFFSSLAAHCRSDALLGNSTVDVAGFQTRGLNQAGAIEWELQGQQARIKGAITEVETFQVILHQDQNRFYDLSSPQCSFYHNQNEIKSNAPVLLRSEGIVVSGLGYDIFLDHKIVLIRSTVHIILQGKSSSYKNLMPKQTTDKP